MPAWLQRADPQRTAVETFAGSLTYGALLEAARAADPTGPLAAEPTLDFVVGVHARLLRGRPVLPVDPRLSQAEVAAQGSADGAIVVHTSGTTGRPRPVGLTLGNVETSAAASAAVLGLSPDTRWLCPLPLSHVGGLMVLLRAAIHGFTAVLAPLDRLGEATVASLVPTQLARLLDAGHRDGPEIVLGGAGAPRALLERAAAAGVPVRTTYGLTQTCSMVTLSEPGDTETSGAPLPGAQIEIGGDGEILVRGPMVAAGGQLATGDLGRLTADGRLVVIGRKDDLIVSGGENVAPAEVEAVLLEHPQVRDAAVYGRPDPEWGQAVTARIVPREGAPPDPDELRAFCRERLAGFKVPKAFEIAGEPLPRTASGKLLRRQLP
jgi:O-succinylbenzoic acid--CoA ligase